MNSRIVRGRRSEIRTYRARHTNRSSTRATGAAPWEEPDGVAAALAHTLRRRKIVEASSSKGVLTGVGILVTGAISMIVIGVQRALGMH
jgi:hypothetical protein